MGLALVLLAAVPASAQDGPRFSLSSSFNYSTGDYGTSEDTEIIYVPFTFGVKLDRLELRLTVPYIRQTSQIVTLTGGGVAVRKDKKARAAQETDTESGLGDVLLRGSYVLLQEQDVWPEVTPYVKIKFPTADEDRGLGTGEFDETFGVDLSKTFLERVTAFLGVGYTIVGSPAGSDFDNSFGWSVGAAYAVARPFSVFAFLDGATAISSTQEDPLELRVGAEWRLTNVVKVTGAVTRGLSDGSADWGVSAGLALRF
ncbi:MAG TPA: transporter [Methylomirabilota bacterium]|nr:transporter [Methylomirabilota bacterium]